LDKFLKKIEIFIQLALFKILLLQTGKQPLVDNFKDTGNFVLSHLLVAVSIEYCGILIG
jgi:hypothetical protein